MDQKHCPFCVLASGQDLHSVESKQSDIFFQDETAIAFISAGWWPHNPGSVLVVPKDHFLNIYDVPKNIYGHVNEIARQIAIAMKAEFRCPGTSLRQHNEAAGGQSVMHYHQWVFPRYENDRLYELYSKGAIVPVGVRADYARRLEKYF